MNGILTGFHERQNPVQPASTAWDLESRPWDQTERAGAGDIGEKETAETSVVTRDRTYAASFDWGNIDQFTFNSEQLNDMKQTCQKQCFSTLNHNLAYCYNARVIKWMCENVKRGFRGGVRSFED